MSEEAAPKGGRLHLTGFDLFLWALGFVQDIVLLSVLWFRRRTGEFPIFTALVTLYVVRTVILYLVFYHASEDAYFYTYWTLGFLDMALQLVVAYEMSTKIFRPLGEWVPEVRRNLAILGAISLALAIALTWLGAPATDDVETAIVIRGTFFSSALLSELSVVMVALATTFGLPMRTHVARIVQGWGLFSLLCILVDSTHTYFGDQGPSFIIASRSRIVMYSCCCVYWIVSLYREEPEPLRLPQHVRIELNILQQRASMVLQDLRAMGSAS